jgi:hydroxyacylglutathione hydrolase
LLLTHLGRFVKDLMANPWPIPAYYQHMAPINRAGAAEPRYEAVPDISPAALPHLMHSGAAVVDVRPRRQFADAHLRGALNMELAGSLPTYFGWLVPFSAPFVVVAPGLDEVVECRRLLARIGREAPVAWAQADFDGLLPTELLGHYEVTSFGALAQRYQQGQRPHVVDVRFPHEWQAGHIRGARNVPLPQVASASPTLSTEEKTWAHCAAGYRAAIAASVLSARGCLPVLVDDNLDNAVAAGLEVV